MSVLAVAAGTFAAAMILVLVTLPGFVGEVIGLPGRLARAATSFAGVTGLVALAFAFVPRPRPGLRALWLPALVTGLAIYLLSELFVILGPLLFGSAQLYGAFGAFFLGLVWLGNVTQVLLLGAAWVAERDRRARPAEPDERHERGRAGGLRPRRRRRTAGQPWRLPQRRQKRALAESERPQLTQACTAGSLGAARGGRARRREDLLAGCSPDARGLGPRRGETGSPRRAAGRTRPACPGRRASGRRLPEGVGGDDAPRRLLDGVGAGLAG